MVDQAKLLSKASELESYIGELREIFPETFVEDFESLRTLFLKTIQD